MVYRFSHKTYRRPLPKPLRTAHGWWAEREGLIIRLEDEQGRVGFGEVAPIPWFGTETMAAAEETCRKFGDSVDAGLLDAVPESQGCVRFALAQARGGREAPAVSLRLPVAALLPAGREALGVLREKLAGGFQAFKWKVGVGPVDDELGQLDDLLAGLPPHATLRLDANGGWTPREAGRWLARCADRPVEFVEQPVAPAEQDVLLGLAGDYPVKLALDESVASLAAARHWQGLGWSGVFVMKPALTGPLAELAGWICGTKADVVFSSAIETALGRSAILEAVLGQSLTKRALGFGTAGIFGDRLWDGPFIGPVADASCIGPKPGEALWNALS